jgi:alkylation response protein AidB-like acyl-CoA dehydrogenase
MDLRLSDKHLAFRDELRAWLAANLPRPWREEVRDPAATEDSLVALRRRWQKKLYEAGYLGMDWPTEWGGRGGTEVEKAIFEAELARADAPLIPNLLGVGLLGPALIHHGSEAQRRRFIPPMLSGDEIWCQGFSEPGAGSDLAALRTSARVEGDHFVLNGQKIWTTLGPWADWIFVLARTDGKDRYGGISFILCPLKTPGIEVRPLRQITGESEFGEVFFEEARVPRENLVGQVGEGWRIAMTVLAYERGAVALAYSSRYARDIGQLGVACKENGRTGTAVREKLGRLLVENEVMRANGIRMLANLADGRMPGPEASLEKLFWSEFDKRFRETALDILGPGGQLLRTSPGARLDVDWARDFLWSRAGTIYSGSSEVQRNIVAKRVLNLPQDAR